MIRIVMLMLAALALVGCSDSGDTSAVGPGGVQLSAASLPCCGPMGAPTVETECVDGEAVSTLVWMIQCDEPMNYLIPGTVRLWQECDPFDFESPLPGTFEPIGGSQWIVRIPLTETTQGHAYVIAICDPAHPNIGNNVQWVCLDYVVPTDRQACGGGGGPPIPGEL